MPMGRRQKTRARNIAAGTAFLLLLPLMTAAVYAAAPDPETAVLLAAGASAMLSVGDVFPAESPAPAEAVPSEDKPPEKLRSALFALDDSLMLSYGAPSVPNSSDEERVADKSSDVGPEPYPESLESRDGAITAMSYGVFNGDNYIDLSAGQVRNVTSVSNSVLIKESRSEPSFAVPKNGEPLVLIMHTHATESYEPRERDFYDKSFNSRTTDTSKNMIAVGDALTRQLEKAGIGVIHDTTLHDYPSYNDSYDRSRETVTKILEEYPSIQIVLDIHRDAIERQSGERIAPVAEINGKNAAQVMIISGCDDGTMGMPNYLENFRFACALQRQLETDWQGLTRPVLFDYRKYNQDLTTGSLLIEVGGHANSIDQAVYSGELIGKSLAKLLST